MDNAREDGQAAALLALVRRYAGLRWIGIGLFPAGALLAIAVLGSVLAGRMEPGRLMFCLLCTALPLSAFGISNDTAVASMRDLGRIGRLPEEWKPELVREASVRRERLRAVQASPRTALAVPVMALLALGWVGMRLAQAWEL